ncbi:MAG: bifunctional oligoribonuclease/PAP phosphatase NrnA [Clostridia bacterium]|nr:bifunctional oligoribonuclease/PAP phosphatase NrnA [Clostridia bacterium]
MTTKLTLNEALDIVRAPKHTLVLCHKNPDPDTLGSAFGLKHILEHFGSRVDVACCDKPSAKFSFITGGACTELKNEEYERIIAVDVASPMQLGELSCFSDRVDLIIDHHAMNTRFAPYYEDLGASCAEIIFSMYKELGIKMPKHFFECIYAGMSGDTGGFRYSNVTTRSMEYGAEVISHGIDHAEINRIIFDSRTLGEIKAQKLTFEKMELLCDGALAVIMFTNEMKDEISIGDEDISDIVNSIRSIEGVLVAVSLKQSQKDPHKFSVSSRSNCDIDVSAVCVQLGGGGHVRASGATVVSPDPVSAFNTCIPLFEKAVKDYKDKSNG